MKQSMVLGHQVFGNYRLWLMSVNYFCISITRQGMTDWGPLFLKVKGSSRVRCEVGGEEVGREVR